MLLEGVITQLPCTCNVLYARESNRIEPTGETSRARDCKLMRTNERGNPPLSTPPPPSTASSVILSLLLFPPSAAVLLLLNQTNSPSTSSQLLSAYERRPFSFCHLDGTDVRAGQVLRSWAFKLIRPQLNYPPPSSAWIHPHTIRHAVYAHTKPWEPSLIHDISLPNHVFGFLCFILVTN